MASTATDQVGHKILQLLGIKDEYIMEATIHIKANDIITAEVTHLVCVDDKFVLDEEETELETLLKKYKLVEIEE